MGDGEAPSPETIQEPALGSFYFKHISENLSNLRLKTV